MSAVCVYFSFYLFHKNQICSKIRCLRCILGSVFNRFWPTSFRIPWWYRKNYLFSLKNSSFLQYTYSLTEMCNHFVRRIVPISVGFLLRAFQEINAMDDLTLILPCLDFSFLFFLIKFQFYYWIDIYVNLKSCRTRLHKITQFRLRFSAYNTLTCLRLRIQIRLFYLCIDISYIDTNKEKCRKVLGLTQFLKLNIRFYYFILYIYLFIHSFICFWRVFSRIKNFSISCLSINICLSVDQYLPT